MSTAPARGDGVEGVLSSTRAGCPPAAPPGVHRENTDGVAAKPGVMEKQMFVLNTKVILNLRRKESIYMNVR